MRLVTEEIILGVVRVSQYAPCPVNTTLAVRARI